MYRYSATLIKIVDGNTIEAEIDLGFNISIKQKIRLFGVAATQENKELLARILPATFVIDTMFSKRGKTGRIFGTVYAENLININTQLSEGFK